MTIGYVSPVIGRIGSSQLPSSIHTLVEVPMADSKKAVQVQETEQEYYEFRTYKIFDFEKQQQVEEYLQTALICVCSHRRRERPQRLCLDSVSSARSVFVTQ